MNTAPRTLDEHYDLARSKLRPDHTILMDEGSPISFQEFQVSVRRLVQALREAGVGAGRIVGYSVHNGLPAFTLPVAISRLGAACQPLYPMIPDEVRAAAFVQGRASFAIVARATVESFSAAAATQGAAYRILVLEDLLHAEDAPLPAAIASPEQPFLLTTSSGTTGKPKAVFLSQRNVASSLAAARDLSSYGPWSDDPDYRAMIAFPQSTSGVMILLGTAFLGVCQVFTRSLSPARFLEIAHAVDADAISAPPAWLEALLAVPVAPTNRAPSIRGVAVGMDFLSSSLLLRLSERFPALEGVANGYGLVETATVFMRWKGSGKASFEGSTSVLSLTPGVGNEIRVCDGEGQIVSFGEDGELRVKGPSVVGGYLGTSDGFEDGWFRTGDIVRSVDATTVELRGRSKYLVKRGGKSVSPLVVQDVVDRAPGVLRSAVVGVPHPLYGEMVWAFVVPVPGVSFSPGSVMKTARAELPVHMVPDRVEVVDSIPLGRGVGKVDREALIARGQAILQSLGV